jgi:hypothetical protein
MIQIVISELDTLTPTYPTVRNMASKVGIKQKALSVANKLHIIKKVDTEPHVTLIKLAELGIPVSTLSNIMASKNNNLHQGGSSEPSRTNIFFVLPFENVFLLKKFIFSGPLDVLKQEQLHMNYLEVISFYLVPQL